jgi:hypothetical protein
VPDLRLASNRSGVMKRLQTSAAVVVPAAAFSFSMICMQACRNSGNRHIADVVVPVDDETVTSGTQKHFVR